ncbi:uncharacterized protein LY79DRAFT_171438 [Colletotrichum navitas]|uniref:Uncharacterized protein n=1 Tax=Colletotrichum navitas TaxID=681940 RepID=A0AAD8V6X3_9PEZI|nr:uncharacterized protein LY79DRAFT_171438 [Colletotrichum navitas]KAK1593795.1 hypothetical protein LY79DRAFT_171438 [Colletotrichum navitas]
MGVLMQFSRMVLSSGPGLSLLAANRLFCDCSLHCLELLSVQIQHVNRPLSTRRNDMMTRQHSMAASFSKEQLQSSGLFATWF